MHRWLLLIAVGSSPLLFAAVLPGEPLFDRKPGHAWDAARDAFYTRRFSTGETFADPRSFVPPWYEYVPFVQNAEFYEKTLAALDALQKLPAADMEEQPAVRRVVLLRDLWAAFDGLRRAKVKLTGSSDDDATKATNRRDELQKRIAAIMKRLELTEKEVASLPNVLAPGDGVKKEYPSAFDAKSPETPFLPLDLLDGGDGGDSGWVTFSRGKAPGAGGQLHMDTVGYRSMFTMHLRHPEGRAAGEAFLKAWTKSGGTETIPPGTTLALLRRAIVPARDGKLVVAPLVESLQLIVVAPPRDHFYKFTLDRAELLAGQPGLRPLGKDDPADATGFESGALWTISRTPREPEADGETLLVGRLKSLKELPPAISTCAACHGPTVRSQLYANFTPGGAFLRTDPDESAAAVLKTKEAREDWKRYLRLR